MKKTKMFFPVNVNTGKTGYVAGVVNDVLETPGSVQRWLNRGCTIVKEEPKKEEIIEEPKEVEKVEEKEENEVVEEVVVPKKTKKRTKKSK